MNKEYYDVIKKLKKENENLKSYIREAYEVWAGSEGCKAETAVEAYQDDIITQMKNVLSEALKYE